MTSQKISLILLWMSQSTYFGKWLRRVIINVIILKRADIYESVHAYRLFCKSSSSASVQYPWDVFVIKTRIVHEQQL